MNVLYSLLIGVVSGLISTLIVFIYWQIRKPNLKISKEIAKNKKGEYRVKIVNKSHLYATNLRFQLLSVSVSNGNGALIYNVVEYKMPYAEIMQIAPYKRKDKEGKYAIRFVLPRDFNENWKDDNRTNIRLVVYCANEYNTSSKVFEQVYYKKDCIKNGVFDCNESMRIISDD